MLGFVAQNQRNGTVGPCQTTRACQAEEATMKEGRDLARVGCATLAWGDCVSQHDRVTQHGRAALLIRVRASWGLKFAFWRTVFLAARVLL